MRTVTAHLLGAALVAALISPVLSAKDHKGGPHGKSAKHAVIVIDRDSHRRVITEYYSREALPPGLAKRDTLPPGLRKQLRERGHLPPGLQKRLTPVPAPLVVRLPAVPPYYTRYFAGGDLIIVDRRTNRIWAIIPDALPR